MTSVPILFPRIRVPVEVRISMPRLLLPEITLSSIRMPVMDARISIPLLVFPRPSAPAASTPIKLPSIKTLLLPLWIRNPNAALPG